MIFIKFNYLDERSAVFCLDNMITMDSDNNGVKIVLENGRIITLPVGIEELCSKVFSDENMINEYAFIEIDEIEPLDLSSIYLLDITS